MVSESCAFFKSNPYKRFIDELTNSNYTLDEIKDLQIKCDNGSNYYESDFSFKDFYEKEKAIVYLSCSKKILILLIVLVIMCY